MKIIFRGAARTVTGSCFQIECGNTNILVDCGMFQGSSIEREMNKEPFSFSPEKIDALLLTHAHIDHSGLIPRLCQEGFRGKIFATQATVDLCRIMLPDSGYIQEMEAEWHNRKRVRQGEPPVEPLYTAEQALKSLEQFVPVHYGEELIISSEARMRFRDAGHILGSAIIELWLDDGSNQAKVVFSGDLGQTAQPIIRDPSRIEAADFLIVESTYGGRRHENSGKKLEFLERVIMEADRSGGKLIIPSFAVGRTQDLLYHIKSLRMEGRIPPLPVYIDSPMAISATETFKKNPMYYDDETHRLLREGESPFEFPELYFTRSTEESKRLNELNEKAIIISASGMCDAGRILHHLRHNLWRPEAHILFVGYQAEGSLGRRIVDGARGVKIFGEEIQIQAKIHSIDGFSAHADMDGLLSWMRGFVAKPKAVFLTHGDESIFSDWSREVQERLGYNTFAPERNQAFDLTRIIPAAKEEVRSEEEEGYAIRDLLLSLDGEFLDLRGRVRERVEGYSEEQAQIVGERLRELQELMKTIAK